VICGEIFWILLIALLHSRGATIGFLGAAATLALLVAVRCGFSFVLIVTPDHVMTRTFARTRRWRYVELNSADIMAKPLRKPSRKVVVLNPKVGRPYPFTTLEEDPVVPSEFDAAVSEINLRIFADLLQTPMGQQ
jgi:hypothetical protein